MKRDLTIAGEMERRQAITPTVVSDFLVPFLTATAWAGVFLLLLYVCTFPLWLAGALACIVWGLVFYWRVRVVDESRWATERMINHDLDGDGHIGPPEIRYQYVNTTGLGDPHNPADSEVVLHALDVIGAAEAGARNSTRNQWRGQVFPSTGKRCTDREWEALRDWLVRRKFATDGGKAVGLRLRVGYEEAKRRCGL